LILVIGAGISGLSAAFELIERGEDVLVLDRGEEAGGLVGTDRVRGYQFERGPNSVPASAVNLVAMARELGLGDAIIESGDAAQERLVFHRGRLLPVPTGPGALLKSDLFTFPQKMRVLAEPFIPRRRSDGPESIALFVARRFGRAPARTLVDAFVSGIYAGDARRVGADAAFPKLVAMEKEHGSIVKALRRRAKERRKAGGEAPGKLINFEKGFGQLTEALAARIGSRLRLQHEVESIKVAAAGSEGFEVAVRDLSSDRRETVRARGLVVTVPSRRAGLMLTSVSPMMSDLLFDISYAPLLSIHAGFDETEIPNLPPAFGFLVPRPQRVRTLGWLFNSTVFAGRAPEGKIALTGYLGGASDEAALEAHPDAITHLALGELSMSLRMSRIPKPDYWKLNPYLPGIPQYDLGHRRRSEAIATLLGQVPGLGLAGNYLGGISLDDCVKNGREAAARVAESVGRSAGTRTSEDQSGVAT
jgi:protoporphyrinogen/coproporphyrinogen III oxidase